MEKVILILDVVRMKWWNKNNHGYTSNINGARLFKESESAEMVNTPYNKDLVKVEITIEQYEKMKKDQA